MTMKSPVIFAVGLLDRSRGVVPSGKPGDVLHPGAEQWFSGGEKKIRTNP